MSKTRYIENLPAALARLDSLINSTPEFAFHLRGCEALADGMRRTETEDEMKDFTLKGLLHEPVLITHKYFGLLQGNRKALKPGKKKKKKKKKEEQRNERVSWTACVGRRRKMR